MNVRCQRGHRKVRGRNCRTCQNEWQKLKYRNNDAYRDHKKTTVMRRYRTRIAELDRMLARVEASRVERPTGEH